MAIVHAIVDGLQLTLEDLALNVCQIDGEQLVKVLNLISFSFSFSFFFFFILCIFFKKLNINNNKTKVFVKIVNKELATQVVQVMDIVLVTQDGKVYHPQDPVTLVNLAIMDHSAHV